MFTDAERNAIVANGNVIHILYSEGPDAIDYLQHGIRDRVIGSRCALTRAVVLSQGGVAFWAHVGGFVAGVVMIKLLGERPHRYRYGTW